ncbi:MAG: LytTR family DNA-binding domain-containing protein [Bacteroidota bacterium]
MNCVIIDDEPLARQLLRDYLEKTPDLDLLADFGQAIEGLQFVQEQPVNLIFLDIQMPDLTGIQFLKILNRKCPVILTTAYSKYALEGYEHDVIDYLLKPITFDRFLQAVQKAKDRIHAVLTTEPVATSDYFFVKSEYKTLKVNYNEVRYLQGLGDYVAIHTTAGKILTLENMRDLEARLPGRLFIRVHRSYLIALSAIDYIERNRIVLGEERIPLGNSYAKAFWERIEDK